MNSTIPMPARKWLLRIGLPSLILTAAATVLIIASWSTLLPAQSVRTVSVVTRQIETDEPVSQQDDMNDEAAVQAPGWVEADPFSVYAPALAEGVVEEVLVLEGDRVSKDQPVARLIDDEAEIALRRSEANLQHLIADLELAKAKLAQLPARIKSARANQYAIEDEVRRKTALVESGAVAAGPLERLKQKLDAAMANIEHLELEEKVLQVEVQDRESLVMEGRAARDHDQLILDRMTVVSPIDGVVIERLTSPGSVIQFGNGEHGTHIVHLYNPEKLQVRADIPLAQAAAVKVGHPARIIVDVQPDKVFMGEVTRFIHRADIQKNTVEAKIRIADPSDLLKPDMLARVRILPASTAPAAGETRQIQRVFVPGDSIRNNKVMIFLPGTDGLGLARSTTVTTGSREFDGWVEILTGLSAGDRVILDDVTDGDTVRMEER
ncbi:MAG: efflux RND transporter periplasmic adaptor subunit [Phycisphaerales bacterium]|nr:efflux RND transporter periplasmic adaptor subunit [Phycisphaerales bacterium]